jgi:hypothetical protein
MRTTLLATVAAAALGFASMPAHATFILDSSCGQSSCNAGDKMFIDVANSDVPTFTNHVDGDLITANTTGNVDTGSGFATIKPTKGSTLTDLIFTPADDTAFSDFSFRGQLERSGFTGTVDVKWTDSSGTSGTITFTGVKGPNADFNRLGIVSIDGETLKSVEVSTPGSESFKEFKQVEFSPVVPCTGPNCGGGGGSVPEPASVALLGVGLLGLGFAKRKLRLKN